MIQTQHLTKRFGKQTAVDDLTFTVEPGHVTGFLGPNGAGKSTTMRVIMGFEHPSTGTATVNGQPVNKLHSPLTEVGACLDPKMFHPRRTARDHLQALAATGHLPHKRVDEVLEFVGLTSVADKMAGTFSLGMVQRLGIATALIGDPSTVILDEPFNGLDPEGVLWLRETVRGLAGQGRTVFLSSHLMSEMAQTADHLIVIGAGRLLADKPIADMVASASQQKTRVRSPQVDLIAQELTSPEVHIDHDGPGTIIITGISCDQIGDAAAQHGWVLHELVPIQASLEDVFLELTKGVVEFHSGSDETRPTRQRRTR